MGKFKPGIGSRMIRFKCTDEEWFRLKELIPKIGCEDWTCFMKKLIKHGEDIVNLLNRLPP